MYSNLFGEFMGTMVLCAYGNTVVANLLLKDAKGNGAGWVHVNWGWSFGLMMGIFTAWACGAPQGDLNPAVTIFKFLAGGIYTLPQAVATCIAEIAGGVAGGVVCYLTYLNHWGPTEDPGLKLAVFATVPARFDKKANFITEVIATFFLIFGIFTIVATPEIPGFIIPFLIGGLLYALGAGFGGPTGYGMNPARDLGPRIAHAILPIPGKGDSGWDYAPIPFAAPIVGGLVALVVCKALNLI